MRGKLLRMKSSERRYRLRAWKTKSTTHAPKIKLWRKNLEKWTQKSMK